MERSIEFVDKAIETAVTWKLSHCATVRFCSSHLTADVVKGKSKADSLLRHTWRHNGIFVPRFITPGLISKIPWERAKTPNLHFKNFFFKLVTLIMTVYYHLLYGKLREWARWTKSRAVIGYLSWQDGAKLPARDCPFCSRNNISPKSRWVHENFLSQNIFRDSKKIFCDFSVRMELKNEKTETRSHFCI